MRKITPLLTSRHVMSQYLNLIQTYEASKSGINPFTSSKAGVESLTKTLALELADIGIRVNGIAPGIISTNTNQELLDNKEKKKQKCYCQYKKF